MKTIAEAYQEHLETVKASRSEATARAYGNAWPYLLVAVDPDAAAQTFTEDVFIPFLKQLKDLSPSTERLYISAFKSFCNYLVTEKLAAVDVIRVNSLVKQRARRQGPRLPQFPRDAIEKVIAYVSNMTIPSDDPDRLIALRDRALILTLADTGLRIHEACKLQRGDLDREEGKAIITGKGDKEAVIRFTRRSIAAINAYLTARAAFDGSLGRRLTTLPIFLRHDLGRKRDDIKGLSTNAGRDIVNRRVAEALGSAEAARAISPHSFRHYFVTMVLLGSGNLKLAQKLARHATIAVTERYAHLSDDELDKGYYDVFEQ
jgi:integrase/recombinase XerC